VLIAFIVMHAIGISSNIMSLGGIAIAIGAMVDAAIVMIENAHKLLERAPPGASRLDILVKAAIEVGPALFFSLLVITVSFAPVFTLEAQEGRLFKPLVYTYTFSLAAAALLSVTLVPVLMTLFVRGRIMPEQKNPLNRTLIWLYRPIIDVVLRWPKITIGLAAVVLGVSIYPVNHIGSEFMPTLNEGTLFYMPVSLPSMSITKAAELLQTQDKIIKSFPEVESVFGKAGRANTATDPAPTEMFETVINLKPESEWRPGITVDQLVSDMNRALDFPGVSNAWTMPIKARIDMLSTGIRTPVGVKVYGTDLAEIDRLTKEIEAAVRTVAGTTSAFAERVLGGYYLNIEPDRAALDRYGLTINDVQEVVQTALGGEIVTNTVEGRERFSVNVRYPRGLRDDPQAIASQVLVHASDGMAIPLGQVASIGITQGPPSIRTENAQLVDYIYVDLQGRDLGGYVADAQRAVLERVKVPPGYHIECGQFEYLERAKARLQTVIPLTLFIIFLLLYLNFRRLTETLIVMLSAVRADRRPVADVPDGVQHECRRRRRVHCVGGGRGGDGCRDADLSRQRLHCDAPAAPGGGPTGVVARSSRRHHRRRSRARAAQDDDGVGDHGGAPADPLEHRHRLRSNAPHRRADGRRHGVVHDSDPACHSRDLHDRQRLAAAPRSHSGRREAAGLKPRGVRGGELS
jgi:copper/silver efflux system protein